ncbi:methyltransferase domain-containing protein [Chryseobacterium wangxinyae]|uniref:class I SAM-dependent DNA methyltransferase n=1 Tax=Chryseobacterium sp. CY350 TaxID=2997336 RepID=UPI00227051D1|nr:methyltransferase domain-containing protein [Chryseobacterium sp. CY350]MCY0977589.1 methyltransferase domain-containing protein [Chryseobacterium sp. CY350]WBZ95401.1 methyltransferase domain-containing protein [Chryseobacterium sp. CY350]
MEWFESWFDTPYYHLLYNNRDYTEAENFITKLTQELELPQSSKIIDLACGKGRHSVFLNKMGYDVLGLDLSHQSIDFDKQFQNESLKFKVHDMRNPIDSEPVDAVFNLFTSFGYFDNEADDKNVFKSVYNVLKSNGYFVLDYLNEEYVRRMIVPETTVQREEIDFHISKKIENRHIIKDIRFESEGKPYHFFEKVKLHTLDTIKNYAEECGFERIKIWGDYQLNDFQKEISPRCINLFKKK